MKAGTYSINVEAQLILNQRELQLLHHVFSYNHGDVAITLANNSESKYYGGGVTAAELMDFFKNIRAQTDALMNQIQNSKEQIFKNK